MKYNRKAHEAHDRQWGGYLLCRMDLRRGVLRNTGEDNPMRIV